MTQVLINPSSLVPKFRQIADHMAGKILSRRLKVGDKLPSIDSVSQQAGVARMTVVQAYKDLKLQGMIASSKTKGFFVQPLTSSKSRRVLVLFNVMSASKEIIFKAITRKLKNQAQVELFFYNYNLELFENIIRSKADMFHHFIIMPPQEKQSQKILELIPREKLVLIDRLPPCPLPGVSVIHQDFKADVYETLLKEQNRIKKYRKITVLCPPVKNLPPGIISGIKKFAAGSGLNVTVRTALQKKSLTRGTLFITITDEMLIELIELQQQSSLRPGKEIGIISYNENPLKRVLAGGIATLSSDFEQMGSAAAACVLDRLVRVVRNPFRLIPRNSL